jgi:hypothetical protein
MAKKTIADLGNHDEPRVVVGKDMINDGGTPIARRIQEMKKAREEELSLLEAGGYDYDGSDDWINVMKNVGRR